MKVDGAAVQGSIHLLNLAISICNKRDEPERRADVVKRMTSGDWEHLKKVFKEEFESIVELEGWD